MTRSEELRKWSVEKAIELKQLGVSTDRTILDMAKDLEEFVRKGLPKPPVV